MTGIKHDIWQDEEGMTMLCFSGDLGEESRTILEPGSRIIHSFYADSHFDAMTKYYQFMKWGKYTTDFEIDKVPYEINEEKKRAKIRKEIDLILWKDWDPIGVNEDGVYARDEYRNYVQQILNLVCNEGTADQIADRLFEIETKLMRLAGNKLRCIKIANMITQRYVIR